MDAVKVVAFGDRLQVSAKLFDALRHAGLLKVTGQGRSVDGQATWDTWGVEVEEGVIHCQIIDEPQD